MTTPQGQVGSANSEATGVSYCRLPHCLSRYSDNGCPLARLCLCYTSIGTLMQLHTGAGEPAPGADQRPVLQRTANERVLQRVPQRRVPPLAAVPRALQEGLVLGDAAQAAGFCAGTPALQHRWWAGGALARGRVAPAGGAQEAPRAVRSTPSA